MECPNLKNKIILAIALSVSLVGCSNEKTNSPHNEQPAVQHAAAANSNPSEGNNVSPTASEASQSSIVTSTAQPFLERLTQEITIYELDSKLLDKKTTAIPSYSKGDIFYWTEDQVNSFNEGHSVTWGDAIVRTFINIANLIPYDYLQDESISEQLTKLKGDPTSKSVTLTTRNGIVFTSQPYDYSTRTTVVDVDVPDLGVYKVISNASADSGIQNIMKITFKATPAATAKHSITILDLDGNWFEKKSSELPIYSNGGLTRSGEYPLTEKPLIQALRSTFNLIPGNETDMKTLERELDGKETIATLSNGVKLSLLSAAPSDSQITVEVQVPHWGTYIVLLAAAHNVKGLIPDKIVLTLE